MSNSAIAFNTDGNLEIKTEAKPITTKEPEVKKDWTAEEVDDMALSTMKSFGWEDSLPKKDKKDEKAAPKEVEKAISTPENDPKGDKPKPDKKPKAEKPKEEDMADKIGNRIAAENEKLIARIQPQSPPRQQERVPVDKTDKELEDAHLRTVFSTMAEMNPSNADLPKQFDAFLKSESAYQSEWQKENPGKDYDPTAEEHADWYEKNQPDYDARQFNRAEAHIEARAIVNQEKQRDQTKHAIESATQLSETSIEASGEALEEDVKQHLNGIIGENKVMETDGPISDKFHEINSALANKITTASVLMTPGTGIPFDPANPVHAAIQKDAIEFDSDIAALTPAEQRNLISTALGKKSRLLGKTFVPASKFRDLTAEERAKSWNIMAEPALVAKLMTVKAKESMTGWLDTLFNQVGRKHSGDSEPKTVSNPDSDSPVTPTPPTTKPSPPSLGTGASSVTPQSGASAKGENSWETIAKNFG